MTDGFKPTAGMKAAARRALAWKKQGHAGGTRVGMTRANQIAGGRTLSRSTVMRMHSFFSRHAVDKQATGFSTGQEGFPSPGRVAWDLWGGDAGKSWAEAQRNKIVKMRKSVVIIKAEGDGAPIAPKPGKERKIADPSQRIEPGNPSDYPGGAPGQLIRSHVLRVASRIADRQKIRGAENDKIAPEKFHSMMIARGVHPDDLALHGLHKDQLSRIQDHTGNYDGYTALDYLNHGRRNSPKWQRHDGGDRLKQWRFHSSVRGAYYNEEVLGLGTHKSLQDHGTDLVTNTGLDHYSGLHKASQGRMDRFDSQRRGSGYQVWHHRYNDIPLKNGGEVRAIDEVQSDPAQKFARQFFMGGHKDIHKLAPLQDLIQPYATPDDGYYGNIPHTPSARNADGSERPTAVHKPKGRSNIDWSDIGLDRDDLATWSPSEVNEYFTPENWHDMFGDADEDKVSNYRNAALELIGETVNPKRTLIHAPIMSAGPVNQRDFNWDSEYFLPYAISAAIADGKKGILLPTDKMQNGFIGDNYVEPHVARRAAILKNGLDKIQQAWGGDLRTENIARLSGLQKGSEPIPRLTPHTEYDMHERPYYEFPQEMIDAVKQHGWHPFMSTDQFNNMKKHLDNAVKSVSTGKTVVILKAKERKIGDPSMAIPRGNPESYSGLTVRGTSHQDNRGPFAQSFIRSTPLRISERLAHIAELRGTTDAKITPEKYHSLQVSRGAHPEDLALHGLHKDQFSADHEGMTANDWMDHAHTMGPQWHDILLPNPHMGTKLGMHSFTGKSAHPGGYGERVLSVSLHPSADAASDLTSNIWGDHYRSLLNRIPGAFTHPAVGNNEYGSERRVWHHRFHDRDIPNSDIKLRDIEEVQSDPIQKFGKQWANLVNLPQDDMYKMLPMSRVIVPKTYNRSEDAIRDSPAYEAKRGINKVDFPVEDEKAIHAPILGAGPVGRGEFHWDSEYVVPYLIAAAVHDGRNAIMLPSKRMQNGYVNSSAESHVQRRNGETLPNALRQIQSVYGGEIEDTTLDRLHSGDDAQDEPKLNIPETLRRVTEMHPLLRGYRDYLTELTLSLGRHSLLPKDVIKKIVDAGEQTDDATTVRLTNKNGGKLLDYDPNDIEKQFYKTPWYYDHRVDSDQRDDYVTYTPIDSWHYFGSTDPDPIVEPKIMKNDVVTSMHPHTYIKLPYHWRDMARLESAPNQRLLEPRPEAEYQISPFLDAPHAHSALRGMDDLMREVGLHNQRARYRKVFSGDPADDMIMEFHPPKAVRDVLQSEGYPPEFLSHKLRFSLPELTKANTNIANKVEADPELQAIKKDQEWDDISQSLNDPESLFARGHGFDRLFHKLTDHMVTGLPYEGPKKNHPVDSEIRPYYRIPDELQELVRTHGWSPYMTMQQFLNMRENLQRAVKAVSPEQPPANSAPRVTDFTPSNDEWTGFANRHSGKKVGEQDTHLSPFRFNSIRLAESMHRRGVGPVSMGDFHRLARARGISEQELAWGGMHPSQHDTMPALHPEEWKQYLSDNLPKLSMANEGGFNRGIGGNPVYQQRADKKGGFIYRHGVEPADDTFKPTTPTINPTDLIGKTLRLGDKQRKTGTVSLRIEHPALDESSQATQHNFVDGHGEPHIASYKGLDYWTPDGKKVLVLDQVQSNWHQNKNNRAGLRLGRTDFGMYGLENEDIRKMSEQEIRDYFSIPNWQKMFGPDQPLTPVQLRHLQSQALELIGKADMPYTTHADAEFGNTLKGSKTSDEPLDLTDMLTRAQFRVPMARKFIDLPFGHQDTGEWENLMLRLAMYNAARQGMNGVALPHENWQNGWNSKADVEPHVAKRNSVTLPREAQSIVRDMSDLGATMGKLRFLGTGQDLHYLPITDAMRQHLLTHGVTPWGGENPRQMFRAMKAVPVRIKVN